MTQDEFVNELIKHAKQNWTSYWQKFPDEQRLRLSSMEKEIRSISRRLEQGLLCLLAEHLDKLAIELEGQCGCGRHREKRSKSIDINLMDHLCEFTCTYLYCRHCHQGINPVRNWLGLEDGGVSLDFERALTDLTTRMTYGDAVESMKEHHAQVIDRTKAERVTYEVAKEAEIYLQERRQGTLDKLCSDDHDELPQLEFTADGGAIPTGELKRPTTPEEIARTPKTEVRELPKGTREIKGREARFICVHGSESDAPRVVDCHIAPYENTRYTGERMLAAAIEAGLGNKSHIHGVFDMGKWIHTQFEEQFYAYGNSACADIMHVTEYLIDAGRVLVGPQKAVGWGMAQKQLLLCGEYGKVFVKLTQHECDESCQKNENGKCLVKVAETYLKNNGDYMREYPQFIANDLPIGSGEAESGIRHIIKRRMSVAGAWTERKASLLLALLTIRHSGWWDDFWQWRDRKDLKSWQNRREGKSKTVFRGKRCSSRKRAA